MRLSKILANLFTGIYQCTTRGFRLAGEFSILKRSPDLFVLLLSSTVVSTSTATSPTSLVACLSICLLLDRHESKKGW